MQEINYIGEHLFYGEAGHFLLITAFVLAILATISYYFGTTHSDPDLAIRWKRIGRYAFWGKSAAILGAIATLFHMMYHKYYEYEYVWSHVADYLPLKYLFPAFWEGQQGSFLLWIFWHVILGILLLRTARSWEAPTMSVLSGVQVILISMVLGIYFTDEMRLGVTPFNLLRESVDMMDIPLFNNAGYVSMIEGKGLNPLLQNYWMIIHPPTLFLGFASVTIPFCYAIAGFWTKQYKVWLTPVLPWALFSAAILGTGIVMGGAWAYEALSFGGYWAWDPVENASLVPWLILIGAFHTNLVARSTGYSIKATYMQYGLAFLFVLYSTFLTRSGILGDSSVHAFTEMGLEWQLVLFIALFGFVHFSQYIRAHKFVPNIEREEGFSSREFWMFIGALVLLFSSSLITYTTSLPVINKLLDLYGSWVGQDMRAWQKASPADPIAHYNRYQLWIAIFVGLLSGIAQFLIYKSSHRGNRRSSTIKRIGISLLLSMVVTLLVNLWIRTNDFQYIILLFCATFTIVANIHYLASILKFKWKASASVISHVGFGLMIVGVLASGINKKYISNNEFAMRGIFAQEDDRIQKNVYLIKNEALPMGEFRATYTADTMIGHERFYNITFDRLSDDRQSVVESFQLSPYLTYNADKTEMVNPNPDTKRYLSKDIFSHITAVPPKHISAEAAREEDDSLDYQTYFLRIGDTAIIKDKFVLLEDISNQPTHPEYVSDDGDVAFSLTLTMWDSLDRTGSAKPLLALKDQRYIYSYYDDIPELGVRIRATEDGLHRIFRNDNELVYNTYDVKLGESFSFNEYLVRVAGFDRDPDHHSYRPQAEDIAVSVRLEVSDAEGSISEVKPVFLIRENQTFVLKDQIPSMGLTFKFSSIDPTTEMLQILAAHSALEEIPVDIAFDAPRDDFIVLEAIEFPGINLFWIGTTLMMIGMLVAARQRIKSKFSS